MMKLPGDSAYDKIYKWITSKTGKAELTPKLKEEFERWMHCDELMRQHGTKTAVVPIIAKRYKVDRATAYRYLQNAERLFGQAYMIDKDYARVILWKYNLEALQNARKQEDAKAEAYILRNLERLAGLDKENPNLPDFANFFQQINVIVTARPEDIGVEPASENVEDLIEQFKVKRRTLQIEAK